MKGYIKCLAPARGFGARLYPLTTSRTKVLLEHAGKPLMNHSVKDVPRDISFTIATNRKR